LLDIPDAVPVVLSEKSPEEYLRKVAKHKGFWDKLWNIPAGYKWEVPVFFPTGPIGQYQSQKGYDPPVKDPDY
jgi:hypothetical protein